jgi:hypothetical protein
MSAYRFNPSLILCLLLFSTVGALYGCVAPVEQAPNTVVEIVFHKSSLDAVRSSLAEQGMQLFEIEVEKERSVAQWTSIVGKVRRYSAVGDVAQSDLFVGLTKQELDSGFVLVELSISDNDAVFVEWLEQYSLPEALFYDQPRSDTRWGASDE